MTDMSRFIAPKSDQLNSDDLIGGPRVITITRVTENASGSGADQPVNVYFEGDGGKPFRPCKSMRRVMVEVWGRDAQEYAGRSMRLYRDPEVTWGGMKVGGIRISHMSHMDGHKIMPLTQAQKTRKPYRVDPLEVERAAPQADQRADPGPILEAARSAARQGKDAFLAFWKSDKGKAHRDLLRTITDECQKLAAEADAARDDDPFGLPPVDTDLTPEQRAELEAAERAVLDQQREAEA